MAKANGGPCDDSPVEGFDKGHVIAGVAIHAFGLRGVQDADSLHQDQLQERVHQTVVSAEKYHRPDDAHDLGHSSRNRDLAAGVQGSCLVGVGVTEYALDHLLHGLIRVGLTLLGHRSEQDRHGGEDHTDPEEHKECREEQRPFVFERVVVAVTDCGDHDNAEVEREPEIPAFHLVGPNNANNANNPSRSKVQTGR